MYPERRRVTTIFTTGRGEIKVLSESAQERATREEERLVDDRIYQGAAVFLAQMAPREYRSLRPMVDCMSHESGCFRDKLHSSCTTHIVLEKVSKVPLLLIQ